MSAHARLSASAAHRWMRCPGSLRLSESLAAVDRPQESEYAREGTMLHEAAAAILLAPQGGKAIPELDEEQLETVSAYTGRIREYAEGNALFVEQRVEYGESLGYPDSFGTADAIILTADGKELQVHDLKTGRGVEVSAEENEQLMLYAIGVLESMDTLLDLESIERVRLVIHQPRLSALSEWDCSKSRLGEFLTEARDAAERVKQADVLGSGNALSLNPGEEQCRWCPAKAVCPALAGEIEKEIASDFSAVPDDGAIVVPTDDRLLSLRMKAVPMVEAWCSAVRAAVEARLLQGFAVAGFKLVEGRRGNRKWSDEKEAEELLKSFRLGADAIYDKKLISPATAEKRLKDNPRRWSKAASLIIQSEGKPSVAPSDDARPEYVFQKVQDDFDDVDESLA